MGQGNQRRDRCAVAVLTARANCCVEVHPSVGDTRYSVSLCFHDWPRGVVRNRGDRQGSVVHKHVNVVHGSNKEGTGLFYANAFDAKSMPPVHSHGGHRREAEERIMKKYSSAEHPSAQKAKALLLPGLHQI